MKINKLYRVIHKTLSLIQKLNIHPIIVIAVTIKGNSKDILIFAQIGKSVPKLENTSL